MSFEGHYDTAEYVNELFDSLDAYRQRRARLIYSGLGFLVLAPVIFAMFRLVRVSGPVLLAGLIIVVAVAAFVGLRLLSSFIRNEVDGRELEREVRELRVNIAFAETPKPKRDDRDDGESPGHFTIGPDGELVEVFDEEPEEQQVKQ